MNYTSTVTQKGQVTLPKKIRNRLNIKIRERVFIELKRDHIKISPTTDILSMAGSLKRKIKEPVDVVIARESFEKSYTRV